MIAFSTTEDRDIDVTVTLKFKESELRRLAAEGSLCSRLVDEFTEELLFGETYEALGRLA